MPAYNSPLDMILNNPIQEGTGVDSDATGNRIRQSVEENDLYVAGEVNRGAVETRAQLFQEGAGQDTIVTAIGGSGSGEYSMGETTFGDFQLHSNFNDAVAIEFENRAGEIVRVRREELFDATVTEGTFLEDLRKEDYTLEEGLYANESGSPVAAHVVDEYLGSDAGIRNYLENKIQTSSEEYLNGYTVTSRAAKAVGENPTIEEAERAINGLYELTNHENKLINTETGEILTPLEIIQAQRRGFEEGGYSRLTPTEAGQEGYVTLSSNSEGKIEQQKVTSDRDGNNAVLEWIRSGGDVLEGVVTFQPQLAGIGALSLATGALSGLTYVSQLAGDALFDTLEFGIDEVGEFGVDIGTSLAKMDLDAKYSTKFDLNNIEQYKDVVSEEDYKKLSNLNTFRDRAEGLAEGAFSRTKDTLAAETTYTPYGWWSKKRDDRTGLENLTALGLELAVSAPKAVGGAIISGVRNGNRALKAGEVAGAVKNLTRAQKTAQKATQAQNTAKTFDAAVDKIPGIGKFSDTIKKLPTPVKGAIGTVGNASSQLFDLEKSFLRGSTEFARASANTFRNLTDDIPQILRSAAKDPSSVKTAFSKVSTAKVASNALRSVLTSGADLARFLPKASYELYRQNKKIEFFGVSQDITEDRITELDSIENPSLGEAVEKNFLRAVNVVNPNTRRIATANVVGNILKSTFGQLADKDSAFARQVGYSFNPAKLEVDYERYQELVNSSEALRVQAEASDDPAEQSRLFEQARRIEEEAAQLKSLTTTGSKWVDGIIQTTAPMLLTYLMTGGVSRGLRNYAANGNQINNQNFQRIMPRLQGSIVYAGIASNQIEGSDLSPSEKAQYLYNYQAMERFGNDIGDVMFRRANDVVLRNIFSNPGLKNIELNALADFAERAAVNGLDNAAINNTVSETIWKSAFANKNQSFFKNFGEAVQRMGGQHFAVKTGNNFFAEGFSEAGQSLVEDNAEGTGVGEAMQRAGQSFILGGAMGAVLGNIVTGGVDLLVDTATVGGIAVKEKVGFSEAVHRNNVNQLNGFLESRVNPFIPQESKLRAIHTNTIAKQSQKGELTILRPNAYNKLQVENSTTENDYKEHRRDLHNSSVAQVYYQTKAGNVVQAAFVSENLDTFQTVEYNGETVYGLRTDDAFIELTPKGFTDVVVGTARYSEMESGRVIPIEDVKITDTQVQFESNEDGEVEPVEKEIEFINPEVAVDTVMEADLKGDQELIDTIESREFVLGEADDSKITNARKRMAEKSDGIYQPIDGLSDAENEALEAVETGNIQFSQDGGSELRQLSTIQENENTEANQGGETDTENVVADESEVDTDAGTESDSDTEVESEGRGEAETEAEEQETTTTEIVEAVDNMSEEEKAEQRKLSKELISLVKDPDNALLERILALPDLTNEAETAVKKIFEAFAFEGVDDGSVLRDVASALRRKTSAANKLIQNNKGQYQFVEGGETDPDFFVSKIGLDTIPGLGITADDTDTAETVIDFVQQQMLDNEYIYLPLRDTKIRDTLFDIIYAYSTEERKQELNTSTEVLSRDKRGVKINPGASGLDVRTGPADFDRVLTEQDPRSRSLEENLTAYKTIREEGLVEEGVDNEFAIKQTILDQALKNGTLEETFEEVRDIEKATSEFYYQDNSELPFNDEPLNNTESVEYDKAYDALNELLDTSVIENILNNVPNLTPQGRLEIEQIIDKLKNGEQTTNLDFQKLIDFNYQYAQTEQSTDTATDTEQEQIQSRITTGTSKVVFESSQEVQLSSNKRSKSSLQKRKEPSQGSEEIINNLKESDVNDIDQLNEEVAESSNIEDMLNKYSAYFKQKEFRNGNHMRAEVERMSVKIPRGKGFMTGTPFVSLTNLEGKSVAKQKLFIEEDIQKRKVAIANALGSTTPLNLDGFNDFVPGGNSYTVTIGDALNNANNSKFISENADKPDFKAFITSLVRKVRAAKAGAIKTGQQGVGRNDAITTVEQALPVIEKIQEMESKEVLDPEDIKVIDSELLKISLDEPLPSEILQDASNSVANVYFKYYNQVIPEDVRNLLDETASKNPGVDTAAETILQLIAHLKADYSNFNRVYGIRSPKSLRAQVSGSKVTNSGELNKVPAEGNIARDIKGLSDTLSGSDFAIFRGMQEFNGTDPDAFLDRVALGQVQGVEVGTDNNLALLQEVLENVREFAPSVNSVSLENITNIAEEDVEASENVETSMDVQFDRAEGSLQRLAETVAFGEQADVESEVNKIIKDIPKPLQEILKKDFKTMQVSLAQRDSNIDTEFEDPTDGLPLDPVIGVETKC